MKGRYKKDKVTQLQPSPTEREFMSGVERSVWFSHFLESGLVNIGFD